MLPCAGTPCPTDRPTGNRPASAIWLSNPSPPEPSAVPMAAIGLLEPPGAMARHCRRWKFALIAAPGCRPHSRRNPAVPNLPGAFGTMIGWTQPLENTPSSPALWTPMDDFNQTPRIPSSRTKRPTTKPITSGCDVFESLSCRNSRRSRSRSRRPQASPSCDASWEAGGRNWQKAAALQARPPSLIECGSPPPLWRNYRHDRSQ